MRNVRGVKMYYLLFQNFMTMAITSIDIPNVINITPDHASVAKKINEAPTNSSNADKNRLVDCLIIINYV